MLQWRSKIILCTGNKTGHSQINKLIKKKRISEGNYGPFLKSLGQSLSWCVYPEDNPRDKEEDWILKRNHTLGRGCRWPLRTFLSLQFCKITCWGVWESCLDRPSPVQNEAWILSQEPSFTNFPVRKELTDPTLKSGLPASAAIPNQKSNRKWTNTERACFVYKLLN